MLFILLKGLLERKLDSINITTAISSIIREYDIIRLEDISRLDPRRGNTNVAELNTTLVIYCNLYTI